MRQRDVKISVIVPVYNVEQYLKECLDSIINQDCDSFEIVCINDGSTDNSLTILEEYAAKNSCLRYFTKQNGGLSSARNYGIKKAVGKYIYFLDSDDMLADEKCLSFMVEAMENKSLDVLYFDGRSFYETEDLKKSAPHYEYFYQRDKSYGCYEKGYKLFGEFVKKGVYFASACLQCLRKEYIIENNIFFSEGILYEDNLFSFRLMLSAKVVEHIQRTVLLRRIRKGSIMQCSVKFNNFYSLYYTWKQMLELWERSADVSSVECEIANVLNYIKNDAIDKYQKLDTTEKEKIKSLNPVEKYLIKSCLLPTKAMCSSDYVNFPYKMFHNGEKILLYGAGNIGKRFYNQILNDQLVELVGIVDKNADKISAVPAMPINMIEQLEYDYIVIAIENLEIVESVKKMLIEKGICVDKIKWYG